MKLKLDPIEKWRLWCAVRRYIKSERELLTMYKNPRNIKSAIADLTALRHLKKRLS